MDLLDHRGRLIPRPGMGFVPSTPSPQARPAIADASDEVLSPAIGFEIEPEETEPYEDDDDIDEEDRRAPVRVASRYPEIHPGNGDGETQRRQVLMKGDRRKKTALAQLIRALAARIHDADALYAVANAIPAERRAHFIRSIRPLLKFQLPE